MAWRFRGLLSSRHLGFLIRGAACSQGIASSRQSTVGRLHSQVLSVLQTQKSPSWHTHHSAGYSTGGEIPLVDNAQGSLSLDPEGQILTVTWKDGATSRFHSVWLRHNCHCSVCRQTHSSQKLIDPTSVSHQISISDITLSGAGTELEIEWNGGEQQHTGIVSLDYLRQHCYEATTLQERQQAVKLNMPEKTLPQMDYHDLIKDNSEVLRWLRQINESGVSLLKNVPTEDTMVKKVAEHSGPVEDLIYGELFDVVSTPAPINVAYSTVELDFHMDLVYYESPPGLQFLHCLRFDECVTGGESRFLDVFQVAEEFRATHPDHFSTLVTVPATFQKIHYDRDYPVEMKYQRPHIVLNQHREIVGVNWAPAFEGPLAVSQDDVMPYYAAYEAFAKAIKFSPHIVEYQLRPGDLVTFNNRRILHARKNFELNGGVRHLKGCYVNIDHFKNQVTVFSRLYGDQQPAKRVGNQDWF